jgi:hypothetical protein
MGASQRDADLEDLVRQRVRGTDEYRPRILRPHLPADLRELLTLMRDLHIDVHDTLLMQLTSWSSSVIRRRSFRRPPLSRR